MRSYLKNIILLSFLVLTSEAFGQYTLMMNGDKNPYDTAVAVEIHQYRKETIKLKLGDTLVDSLFHEVIALGSEVDLLKEQGSEKSKLIDVQRNSLERKDSVVKEISANYNELHKIATEPPRFWERPAVIWSTAGGMFLVFEILKGLFNGD